MSVIIYFQTNSVPWQLKKRLWECKAKATHVMVSHNWREANFATDMAAKRGSFLSMGDIECSLGRHSWFNR